MTHTEIIDISSKILKKYFEKYPETSFMQILPITMVINDKIERYGDSAKYMHDTIIEEIYDEISNKHFDVWDLLGFYKPEKKECKCGKQQKDCQKQKDETKTEMCKNTEQKQSCENLNSYRKTYVSDTNDCKIIKVLLPGIEKENIHLTINDTLLNISLKDVVIESAFVNPSFCASFAIDDNYNIDEMDAFLKNGILTITIPKIKKPDTTKVIEIK